MKREQMLIVMEAHRVELGLGDDWCVGTQAFASIPGISTGRLMKGDLTIWYHDDGRGDSGRNPEGQWSASHNQGKLGYLRRYTTVAEALRWLNLDMAARAVKAAQWNLETVEALEAIR